MVASGEAVVGRGAMMARSPDYAARLGARGRDAQPREAASRVAGVRGGAHSARDHTRGGRRSTAMSGPVAFMIMIAIAAGAFATVVFVLLALLRAL